MFITPTLDQAAARARERLRADMPGTDAAVWPNTQYVTAKVLGGETFELYEFIQWVSRQKFATTADGDMLDEIGKQYGLNRKPASAARGSITITAASGATIDAGTEFSRSDGARYTTDATLLVAAGGTGQVTVTAIETGALANTEAAVALSTTAAAATAVVGVGGLGGGAAVEDHESYRARILFRLRNPPHGGAEHDYVAWALAVPGITRVWVQSGVIGPGSMGVWVMADNNGTTYGVPLGTELDAVRAYLDSVRPVTVAQLIVSAPVILPVDITVDGLPTPSTFVQGRIATELRDVFRRSCRVSTASRPFTLKSSLLWQGVSRATGSIEHTISAPGDTPIAAGRLPALGEVSYD